MVAVVGEDRYGRLVGRVRQGDTDVNLRTVEDGFAWQYTTYDEWGEYAATEAEARKATRGL